MKTGRKTEKKGVAMRMLSILFVVFSLTVTVMVSADPFPFAPFPPAPEGAFAVTIDDAAVDLLTAYAQG